MTPHLERFVREQLAAGRFRSEGELLRAALLLLEGSHPAGGRPGSLGVPADAAGAGPTPARPRRSLRGLLADLRSDIDFDELRQARDEMWGGLRPGGDT